MKLKNRDKQPRAVQKFQKNAVKNGAASLRAHKRPLDFGARSRMLEEIVLDMKRGTPPTCPCLNARGAREFPELLISAVAFFDENWLLRELKRKGLVKGGPGVSDESDEEARIQVTSAVLNYYLRGLARSV